MISNMSRRSSRAAAGAVVVGILLAATAAQSETPSRGLDPKNLDRSVSPAKDFYRFANGGWLAAYPVPPAYSRWSSFDELREKNLTDLRSILDATLVDTNAPKGSIVQKVSDFYASAMDSATIEAAGLTPIQGELDRIAAIRNTDDLVAVIAHQHIVIANPLFQFYVDQDAKNPSVMIAQIRQGGLGLPDRDYYTKEDDKSKAMRAAYLAHVAKMFQLLGDDSSAARSNAATVMSMETRLAKASMTRVEQRDPNATYHMMTLDELSTAAPGFNWSLYFRDIGKPSPGAMNVNQPVFFKDAAMMVRDVPIDDWKTYLRWGTVHAAAPWLSSAFVNENFHFSGEVMTGAKELQPRWKRALDATNRNLGEALGMLYVKKFFSPLAKARALEMVENLKAAFRERIRTRAWMSEKTKDKALAKLDAFRVKIGYPDKWTDYSKLDIDRASIIANLGRASQFEFKRDIDRIGGPVDRTRWGMTPPTVNAYYNPTMNEIVFPAGILQPPFFDPEADDAVNYGGIGAVIGHEMTHGFDDEGSQFDADGTLRDWWSPTDKISFAARSQRLEKQFDGYIGIDTIHVNGKLTLGENIADLGGLTIAFAAMKRAQPGKPTPGLIDGFTPEQRFFLAWAQIWRTNYRPEEIRRRLILDPHSLAEFRTNGPLSDMPEFQKAFSVGENEPMTRPTNLRAIIW
jgi:putative endopeptidase